MKHLSEESLEYIAVTNELTELEQTHLKDCSVCTSYIEEMKSIGNMLSESFKLNEQQIDLKKSILDSIQVSNESNDYLNYIFGVLFLLMVTAVFYIYPAELNSIQMNLSKFTNYSFIQSNMNSIMFSSVAIVTGVLLEKVLNHFKQNKLSH